MSRERSPGSRKEPGSIRAPPPGSWSVALRQTADSGLLRINDVGTERRTLIGPRHPLQPPLFKSGPLGHDPIPELGVRIFSPADDHESQTRALLDVDLRVIIGLDEHMIRLVEAHGLGKTGVDQDPRPAVLEPAKPVIGEPDFARLLGVEGACPGGGVHDCVLATADYQET